MIVAKRFAVFDHASKIAATASTRHFPRQHIIQNLESWQGTWLFGR